MRYVARTDREPVAFAALALYTGDNRGVANVVALVVRPDMRRRGVGRAVIATLRARLRECGVIDW